MARPEPTTETITTQAASRNLSEIVQSVSRQERRVVLEEQGEPVAVIVSTDDLERLKELDGRQARAWQVFDEIHARNRDVDPDEVDREVERAIAEVRALERKRKSRSKKG